MANYTRNTLTGSLAPVNNELEKIEQSLKDKLDRAPSTGQTNQLKASLDANSNRILNLPAPSTPNEPARLKDVQEANGSSIFPPQDGLVGNYLSTDGTTPFWSGAVATALDTKLTDLTTLGIMSSTRVYPVGAVVPTSGYAIAGDGGKGDWRRTALTGQIANRTPINLGDGLFNDSNGNQWELVSKSILLQAVGGKSDGATDDSNAIDAGIFWGDKTGGKLVFGFGVTLTGRIDIDNLTVDISGLSMDFSILKLVDNADNHVVFLSGQTSIKLSNLTIDQNRANQTAGHGVRLGGTNRTRFDNLRIINVNSYGIGVQGGSNYKPKWTNIEIENCGSDGIDIKDYNNNNDVIVIDNATFKNVSTINTNDVAIDVRGGINATNITVTTETGSSSRGVRFRQGGSQGRAGFGVINGFVFKGHGADTTIAIDLDSESKNFVISNIDCTDCAIVINQTANSTGGVISNITATGLTNNGMNLGGADMIINNVNMTNAAGSSRLVDVLPTATNNQINNFLFDETTASTQAVRIQAGALNTSLSNGSLRGGVVGDSGTGTVQTNVRAI